MIVASFFGDFGSFFSSLGNVHLVPMLIGMVLFVGYLSLRALAFRNILQDAYPDVPVPIKQVWGAYLAAYGFNNIIPARGGDVLKVYLVKTSIPGSTYPTIGAALLVEAIFDLCAGALAVSVALIAGVFPKPPSWVSLNSVDLSFVAEDGKRALFLVTAFVIVILVLFSLVALRVRTFWAKVRQGFAVLRDRRRYFKRVWAIQGIGWIVRGTAFFFLLRAFGMPASVQNVLFVLSANAVAAIFPFTPGGAGVVQALLVELLKGAATGAAIAAYGVGQQAVIALTSLAVGFTALVFVFNIRSFREVIERGRADREEARAAERAEKRQEAAGDISGYRDAATTGPGGGADGAGVGRSGGSGGPGFAGAGAGGPGGVGGVGASDDDIEGLGAWAGDGGRFPGASGGGGANIDSPAATRGAAGQRERDDQDPKRVGGAAGRPGAHSSPGSIRPRPPAASAVDDWLDDVAGAEPVTSVTRAGGQPPPTPPVDDWLAEEAASTVAREERREARAKWRRRNRRD